MNITVRIGNESDTINRNMTVHIFLLSQYVHMYIIVIYTYIFFQVMYVTSNYFSSNADACMCICLGAYDSNIRHIFL